MPASLSARSFPFTPACPGQYAHRNVVTSMSRAVRPQERGHLHVQGSTPTGAWSPPCPGQYAHRSVANSMSRAVRPEERGHLHVQGSTPTGAWPPPCDDLTPSCFSPGFSRASTLALCCRFAYLFLNSFFFTKRVEERLIEEQIRPSDNL